MKQIGILFACIVCIFVIQGLVRSIWSLWEKQDVLIAKQEELARVKKEYAELKEQEKRINNPRFVEEEIRNKLFLVKPNEKLVILPTDVLEVKTEVKTEKKVEKPAYQQWLALFMQGKL